VKKEKSESRRVSTKIRILSEDGIESRETIAKVDEEALL